MARHPSWVLRCRACKTQFGPLSDRDRVQQMLSGSAAMDCGHSGADVVSESL